MHFSFLTILLLCISLSVHSQYLKYWDGPLQKEGLRAGGGVTVFSNGLIGLHTAVHFDIPITTNGLQVLFLSPNISNSILLPFSNNYFQVEFNDNSEIISGSFVGEPIYNLLSFTNINFGIGITPLALIPNNNRHSLKIIAGIGYSLRSYSMAEYNFDGTLPSYPIYLVKMEQSSTHSIAYSAFISYDVAVSKCVAIGAYFSFADNIIRIGNNSKIYLPSVIRKYTLNTGLQITYVFRNREMNE